MQKKCYIPVKQISLFLLLSILMVILTGCRTVQEKILDNLENAYGTEFEMESFARVGAVYEPICYPVDDPSLLFGGCYDKNGEILMDDYVGALIGKEDSLYLQECIGDDLGESYISRGMGGNLFVTHDTNKYRPVLDLFIHDDYSSKQVYRIIKELNSKYKESYYFIILIDTDNSELEYSEEYDVLENASESLIEKYTDDYGIDIGVNYIVYFLDDEEFGIGKEMLEHYHSRINTFNHYLSDENYICFATDNNNEDLVWTTILTRDEYINEREKLEEA